jgi:hypothetical protein
LNINLLRHENHFRYGLSQPRYDEYVSISEDDRDELIKELLAESFGLRTKAEQLSQYVESRVAELVKAKKEIARHESGERLQQLDDEIRQLRNGLEEANALRNRTDHELRKLLDDHNDLGEIHREILSQRDRLRQRFLEVEQSRSYRISQRIDRFLSFFTSETSK